MQLKLEYSRFSELFMIHFFILFKDNVRYLSSFNIYVRLKS